MPYLYKHKIALWDWYDADTVTSTNDEIKNLLKKNKNIILSAQRQTCGRGRRGRTWHETLGNLYFTYTLNIEPKDLSRMVCLIGLCIAETTIKLLPNKDIKIKWPNDVFIENKKLSGILLEKLEDNLWAIGIGVNIVDSPKLDNTDYQATSLAEQGIILDRTDFLIYYLNNFADMLQTYYDVGFVDFKQRWLELALNYQQNVTIKLENIIKTGIFSALDDNGYLILTTDNKEERIVAGDLFLTKE